MEFNLKKDMVLMDGRTLSSFEYGTVVLTEKGLEEGIGMNPERMLRRLRENPALAAELLSYSGDIVYMGNAAKDINGEGNTLGMQFTKGGSAVRGDNAYGYFLMMVRDMYVAELKGRRIDELSVRPGQIVKDFVPAGEEESYVERMENGYDERPADIRYVLDSSCDVNALRKFIEDNEFVGSVSVRSIDNLTYGRFEVVFNGLEGSDLAAVKDIIGGSFPFSAVDLNDDGRLNKVSFIHTEPYRPVKFRFDARRDGTTGYARRSSDRDVSFQTFECPFGLDYKSKVRVENAVEASLLYEKALRQELDWKQLFVDLRARGLVKNLDAREEETLIRDLRAQFAWMREEICRNRSLGRASIVCDSMLIPDASFGRSIYDADTAPSPAHVLARYINNPLLFFSESENGVLRALQMTDKNEAYRFSAVHGDGSVTIIVDGSDTIGGRVLNTRATSYGYPVYRKDSNGRMVVDQRGNAVVDHIEQRHRIEMKSQRETDADYAVFSSRMDDILSNISPEVKVKFVTGDGIGIPQMVRRYVQDKGGCLYEWDYKGNRKVKEKNQQVSDDRFSQVRMSHFNDVLPVLVGQAGAVSFHLDERDDRSVVDFGTENGFYVMDAGGLGHKGYIEFSFFQDRRNRRFLDNGSLAVNAGIPTIHVQDNLHEKEQSALLSSVSTTVRDRFVGERHFDDTLFGGELRRDWDTGKSDVLSYVDAENSLAVPEVGFCLDATTYVGSVPFHSIYGTYVALLAKESGIRDVAFFKGVNENSMSAMAVLAEGLHVSPEVQEKCMRNAVHMMVQASSRFADRLLSLEGEDIVCVSSYGGDVLFTDLAGHGENRFGIVLKAERDALVAEMENIRQREQEENRRLAEANARMIRRASTVRATGEKMSGGLPAGIEDAAGAVWFLGTCSPNQLALDEDKATFAHWEVGDYRVDALNRELASRAFLDDGNGDMVPNNYIFVFPSDELACTGRRHVMNNPDSMDLTGLKRVNPATGEEFVCAFGIPVKRDNQYYEQDNKFGRSCSFRNDQDSSVFYHSIIAADSLARVTAIEQGMALCYAKREKNLSDGSENDDLTRVFMDKVWDYPRTQEVIDRNTGKTISEGGVIMPREVRRRVYDKEEDRVAYEMRQVVRKEWVDNPHAAPLLRSMLKRYEKILVNGADYPLNCICMPETVYPEVLPEDGVHTVEQRREMAENRFLSDFTFALNIANATAISLGVPMRFPLGKDGKLDLGMDVPPRFRDIAERKLDAFINVVREDSIINDELPRITRIPLSDTVRGGRVLTQKGDGSDIYIRPNDLLMTFGPYNFRDINAGLVVPLHEMAFRTEDGTLFRVVHPKLTRGMQAGEINRYLRYEKNEECRFTIKSSDPDRIPQFVVALKSYIERAKRIGIETRLLSEEETAGKNMGLDGFVRLLSSNSDRMALEEGEVSARGVATGVDLPNRFDGTDNDSVYYGKEDAKDAFAGYAQFRYTLPDGSRSDWVTVTDREVALDLIYSKVNRVYRSDLRVVPSPLVLEAEIKALAVKDAGERFIALSQPAREVRKDDRVVESERYEPVAAAADAEVKDAGQKRCGRVFVTYYGSRSVPEDAIKVQISTSCPEGMKDDMDYVFESLKPDYAAMVGPHKEGKIDDAEYSRRYAEQVLEPNRDRILAGMNTVIETAKEEGKDVYLYCYCKPGAFCHRYLVNNFLNENGIECQENPADRRMYRQGHVSLYGEQPQADLFNQERSEEQVSDVEIAFTRSSGMYSKRTYENAQADDVDFTLQFAVDFNTYGERCTEKAAGDSLISVPLPVKNGKLQMTPAAVGEMAQTIINALPEDFIKGEPFGVNIAGNGIYTLAGRGVDQQSLDVLLAAVALNLRERGVNISSVRSGGQTGVDESGAVMGQVLGVPTTVHAPNDWSFRNTEGRDVRNDEEAFRKRFGKDLELIRSKAGKIQPVRNEKKKSPGNVPGIS